MGAGAGWMKEEFAVHDVDFQSRGRRMDESIGVMRKLWAGGYVEHHGGFFDFPKLALAPAPDAPVPIYIGGSSKRALRRAAQLGQGWIGAGNSIEEVPAILDQLNTLRREYGRESEPFEVVCPIMQIDQIDTLRALEEQGLTSICFGFADNYGIPIEAKRGYMSWFAENVMGKF